ncbi:MAG TPA: hypothetical protein VE088_07040, partial [Gaiellaceae bacterium]|nr:hypothetical protein [Gaiellaceae bacterium]
MIGNASWTGPAGISLHIATVSEHLSHRVVCGASAGAAATAALLLGLAAPAHADPGPAPADPTDTAATQQPVAEAGAVLQGTGNVAISIRIDSPGDNGAVTQAVDTGGTPAQQTTQGAAPAGAPAPQGSDAAPVQADQAAADPAATVAAAAQSATGNLAISIRVASPGSDGPVTQTIAATAAAAAAPVPAPTGEQYQVDTAQ